VTAVADALSRVPAASATVRLYLRHCYIPGSGAPDPLWVSAGSPSRWWTPAGTLYVAEDPDTVMAEHCRNNAVAVAEADPTGGVGLTAENLRFYAPRPVGPPLVARALFSVQVAFDRLADLRSAAAQAALASAGVESDDLLADDFGACPDIAQAGERLGWEALRAPSAALDGGIAVAVFDRAYPPRDRWRLENEAVRPSVRVAVLTRYRAGQRPSWIGAD
jgi:hypothetical protein